MTQDNPNVLNTFGIHCWFSGIKIQKVYLQCSISVNSSSSPLAAFHHFFQNHLQLDVYSSSCQSQRGNCTASIPKSSGKLDGL